MHAHEICNDCGQIKALHDDKRCSVFKRNQRGRETREEQHSEAVILGKAKARPNPITPEEFKAQFKVGDTLVGADKRTATITAIGDCYFLFRYHSGMAESKSAMNSVDKMWRRYQKS